MSNTTLEWERKVKNLIRHDISSNGTRASRARDDVTQKTKLCGPRLKADNMCHGLRLWQLVSKDSDDYT